MKRKRIMRISLLSAFVVLATLPYHLPAIEAERIRVGYETMG